MLDFFSFLQGVMWTYVLKRKNSEVCEMQNDMREGIEEGLKGRMRIEPDEAERDMMMGMSELERT